MLSRCSRESLFHRFHGFSDGADYVGALLRDRPVDETFLAWYGASCVGLASLSAGATGTSDLGVLIEDAWQRRGIGTWLVASLLANARAKGMTTVHADVLGDDQFILQALRRIGPLTVSIEFGSYSIDIDIGRQGNQPSGNNFPVELETATGDDRRLGQPGLEGSVGAGELGRDHERQREAASGTVGSDAGAHRCRPGVVVDAFRPEHGVPRCCRHCLSTPVPRTAAASTRGQ